MHREVSSDPARLSARVQEGKGESQTNVEFSKEDDWARAQEIQEEQVKALRYKLLEFKPVLINTEKPVCGARLSLHDAHLC